MYLSELVLVIVVAVKIVLVTKNHSEPSIPCINYVNLTENAILLLRRIQRPLIDQLINAH